MKRLSPAWLFVAVACGTTGIGRVRVEGKSTKDFPAPWPPEVASAEPVPTESAPSATATAGVVPTVPPGASASTAPTSSSTLGFVAASPQPAAYALIVGIERYRDTTEAATGARADAERMAALFRDSFGLRAEHVRTAVDEHATRGDIEAGLAWLKASVSPGGRVYFTFSGHGAPDGASGTAFIVPYDGDPDHLADTAIPLSTILRALGEIHARDALAVVDSCFSGAGGRSLLAHGVRPLVRVREAAPGARLALFSAAGPSELSSTAPGEALGLFTKYVTLGLGTGQADADGDGQISLQELVDWVSPRVSREARQDQREQHPKVALGSGLKSAGEFIVEYGLPPR